MLNRMLTYQWRGIEAVILLFFLQKTIQIALFLRNWRIHIIFLWKSFNNIFIITIWWLFISLFNWKDWQCIWFWINLLCWWVLIFYSLVTLFLNLLIHQRIRWEFIVLQRIIFFSIVYFVLLFKQVQNIFLLIL